jgi:DNA polymerase (family 10)/putative hydrolase
MKAWKKYDKYLMEGEWHVHTNYTDGENSIAELCEAAQNLNIPLIAFTEHVRKNLTYDFDSFLNDIDNAKEQYDLIILSGCEAKVLENGELDVDPDIIKEIDYPIFAYHSFPADIDLYMDCLQQVLKNPYVNAWAHPGNFLLKYRLELTNEQLTTALYSMAKKDVLLEVNKKYGVPVDTWFEFINKSNATLVSGSDAHSVEELKDRHSISFPNV